MPVNRSTSEKPTRWGGAVRLAGEVHQAAVGLDDEVIAWFVGHRASASVAGNGAVHDVGVDGFDVLVAQPHAGQGSGAEAFDHHVGIFGELFDDAQALIGFEVDGQGSAYCG